MIKKIKTGLRLLRRHLGLFLVRHSYSRSAVTRSFKIAGMHFSGREICSGCYVDAPDKVFVGEGSFINHNCVFHTSDANVRIIIGKNCDIAPEVMFMCTSHEIGNHSHRAGKLLHDDIIIGDGVWIGTRALILPGVKIGDGAIVAAGALVNKDVAADSMVAGIPAKPIRVLNL